MRLSPHRSRTWLARFVAVLTLGLAVSLALTGSAAAQPSFFAAIPNPIGVVYAPSHVLVTTYCTVGTAVTKPVFAIDPQGDVSVFADVPAGAPGCTEDYITVSPGGLPHWPANRAYVEAGANVYEIDPNGNVSLFITSGCGVTHNSITFDEIGLFGYRMLVTCNTGPTIAVDHDGTITPVGSFPAGVEGTDVAPLTFGAAGGYLFAAQESTGNVYAMSPAGTVITFGNYPFAEAVRFIPTNVCEFAGTNGAFFAAIFPTHIDKYPQSDFTAFGGNAVVTSEFALSLGLLTPAGGAATPLQPATGPIEGSGFVDFSRGCRFNKK